MRGANDLITVWNKTREGVKDVWYRHVVYDCSWENHSVRTVSGQTVSLGSTIGVLITENPLYKSPNEWAAGDKTAFFTLNLGDLVALGEQIVEITGVSPYTETAVKQSLMPDVFVVKIVDDNTAPYKRGRHYYVEGI